MSHYASTLRKIYNLVSSFSGFRQLIAKLCIRTLSTVYDVRSVLSSGPVLVVAMFVAQLFDYLIVIDFESTCWQGAKHNTQEISK